MTQRNPAALDSVSGNGFTIDFYQDIGWDDKENRIRQIKGVTSVPWGTLIGMSWGSVVYNWIKAVGEPGKQAGYSGGDVLTDPAYNIGKDNIGGVIWLIPTHTSWQGLHGMTPVWIEAHVYPDAVSQAVLDNSVRQNQADAAAAVKMQELADLQARGQQGNLDQQIAIQKAKNGQGFRAYELTLLPGGSIFVALSPQESATSPLHNGVSIIDPGAWEELAGASGPGAYGLPIAILSAQPSGGVRIGSAEYKMVLAAAQSQPTPPSGQGFSFLSQFLGFQLPVPQPAPTLAVSYSVGQIRAARQALDAMGLSWQ